MEAALVTDYSRATPASLVVDFSFLASIDQNGLQYCLNRSVVQSRKLMKIKFHIGTRVF